METTASASAALAAAGTATGERRTMTVSPDLILRSFSFLSSTIEEALPSPVLSMILLPHGRGGKP